MSKVIGIPGYKQQDSNGFGVGNHYLNLASNYGNPRIIMPWEEHVPVDLLILPGGLDLNPTAYGQLPSFYTSNQDVFKQFFYDNRLSNYINAGTPVFGICLGFQQLVAYFGGELTQNMPYHRQSPGRQVKGHPIYFTDNVQVLGYDYLKPNKSIEVNSHHHQGVLVKNAPLELTPLAVAPNEEYGDEKLNPNEIKFPHNILEAFIHRDMKVGGVQYHPEEWSDYLSDSIIKHLLNVE